MSIRSVVPKLPWAGARKENVCDACGERSARLFCLLYLIRKIWVCATCK